MPRRIGVLINPTSGKGRSGRLAPQVLTRLRTLGDEVIPIQATSPEEADRLIEAEMATGLDILVAVGGDGTVHQAVQHVVGTGTALGIVPLGTGNDGARSLGLPRQDPLAAVDIILNSPALPVDVGRVETDDGVTRHFLNVLSTGFDSMVNVRANNMTRPSGNARYVLAVLAELRAFKPLPYRIEVDGKVDHLDAMLVAVGNSPYYGGGMKICPAADHSDGLLTLTQINSMSRPELIRTFPRIYTGSHVDHPSIDVRDGRNIVLDAPGQIACADGEVVGALPVTVVSIPAGLSVLVESPA